MKRLNEQEVKDRILTILKYVDEICNKNNIQYFVAFGTLLGAIRHKGFIPWDDDVDIYIPQKEYKRFRELVNNDSRFEFSFIFDDDNYRLDFAKVIDKGTVVKESHPIVSSKGLFVDVFPLYHIGKDIPTANKNIKKLKKMKMKFWYYNTPIKNLSGKGIKKLIKMILVLPRKLFIATHNMPKYMKKYYAKIEQIDKSNENTKYIGYVDNARTSKFEKDFFEEDWLETIHWPFESIEVNVPKEYDRILKQQFGDYMQIPSEDERINHNIEAYLKAEA